ncbi:expressed unknown protein [Seminavis robusta]|uniref:Uncharacterized protein n=1 Tax=Seminavis robusta TaxID=568900 RepID=A0A9N8DY20_9STRA|nr:expressed unknown protein [Seminavis robusta]|eukprot:Sro332_g119340.1 n/a (443) ;mRNA; r:46507-48019
MRDSGEMEATAPHVAASQRRVVFDHVHDRGDDELEESQAMMVRRGTPHPSKRFKGPENDEGASIFDGAAVLPPPQFGTEETAHGGDHHDKDDRNQTVDFDNDGVEEEDEEEGNATGNHYRGEQKERESREEENQDENVDNEEEHDQPTEEEKEAEEQWNAFVAQKKSEGSVPYNLQQFLNGQQRWADATQRLRAAHQTFEGKMGSKIHEFLEWVEGEYKSKQGKLERLSDKTKKQLIHNHKQRTELTNAMHRADDDWHNTRENLLARIHGIPAPVEDEADAETQEKVSQDEDEHQPDNEDSSTSNGTGTNDDGEITKEMIVEPHEERADLCRRYEEAVTRMTEIQEKFLKVLEESRDELVQKVEHLLQMVEEIHQKQATEIAETESHIQKTMVDNHLLTEEMEKHAKEESQRRQAFFSSRLEMFTSSVKNATATKVGVEATL